MNSPSGPRVAAKIHYIVVWSGYVDENEIVVIVNK